MSNQTLHKHYVRMRDAQDKAKARPNAGWLKEEAKEKEIEYLKAQIKEEEDRKLYGE